MTGSLKTPLAGLGVDDRPVGLADACRSVGLCRILDIGLVGIELWHVDLVEAADGLLAMEQDAPRLSDDDCARVQTMFGDEAGRSRVRRERLATYVALRLVVEQAHAESDGAPAELSRVPFVRTMEGRPSLPGFRGDFSLSHVAGHALIGVAREGSIGVDLERPRVLRMEARRRALIEAAAARMAPQSPLPADGDARFIAAWVRVEAFAKARRISLARLLTDIGALGGGGAMAVAERAVQRSDWPNASHETTVRDLALPDGLVAALAYVKHPNH